MANYVWTVVNGVPYNPGVNDFATDQTGTTWRLGYRDPVSGAMTYPLTVSNVGSVDAVGYSGAAYFKLSTVALWSTGGAAGKLNFTNQAETAGIGFDVTADNNIDFRTRAQTGFGSVGASALRAKGDNVQSLGLLQLTELTTIAANATTDTTIQMPAGAIVLAVSTRVTTVIPTATTFTVGDSGSAARFNNAAVSVAATSTDAGTKAGAYYNASALAIRITPNGTPADNTGRVRVTIYYLLSTPPTS